MKKWYMTKGFLVGLLAAVSISAFAVGFNQFTVDTLFFGRASSTDEKLIEFRTGDSPNNVVLGVDDSRNGRLTTDQLTLGDGTATNKDIILDRGGSNPTIRWNEGTTKLEFSNDGTIFDNIGADDQAGDLSDLRENVGIDTSVAASALTMKLVQKDGAADATAPSPIRVSFRNSTGTNGGYVTQSVTAALSLVVPSGATLGHRDGTDDFVYFYLLDNAGTVEAAVSTSPIFAQFDFQSTTVLDGSSDSANVLYSTTARANVSIRFIARVKSNQTTAGTWDLAPSEESVNTSDAQEDMVSAPGSGNIAMYSVHVQTHTGTPIILNELGDWLDGAPTDTGVGDYTLNLEARIQGPLNCQCTGLDNIAIHCGFSMPTDLTTSTPTSIRVEQWDDAGANTDTTGTTTGEGSMVTCWGPR